MGGCAAEFCNNSSAKGYIMKIFPRDKHRREQWVKNMDRPNWTPTNSSYLCEVHFAPEMWEPNRIDNKRKLKPHAVPTIFGFFYNKKSILSRIYTIKVNKKLLQMNLSMHLQAIQFVINKIFEEKEIENHKCCKINKKTVQNLIYLRKENKILRNTNKKLKNMINNNKYRQMLKEMLTNDQIRTLFTKKRIKNWSNETIQRALKLQFTCGTTGYEELILQGMPLPSLRTLRRKLENLKFESGISNEMFDFLKLKASRLQDNDKECGLVMDEMSITPKNIYDSSTKTMLGNITYPNQKDHK
ncbi:uncharacterized protein LOC143902863 [Temnothorax americanus]|uniref:uncharacterized protein LOC143902863 n=1 Tax=Temnothorax americanus TaxID=1964332 RepID=UPI004067E1DD